MTNTAPTHDILVVEDDAALSRLIEALLQSSGYHSRTVSDGEAALAAVEQARPDLVLLDVTLPGIDGWQVLAQLRSQPAPPPVVLLSARPELRQRGRSSGAAEVVMKPFDIDELLEVVKRLVGSEC